MNERTSNPDALSIPLGPSDIVPISIALTASGVLQERQSTRIQEMAVRRLGKIAHKNFTEVPLDTEQATQLQDFHTATTYWHGSGRYQRHNQQEVDVLQSIMEQGAINPHLDPFDPDLGVVTTTSLATVRLYARAYADMHTANPKNLNRLLDNQHAAIFYVVRSFGRAALRSFMNHPEGMRQALKESRADNQARLAATPQKWSEKITRTRVNPMLAYRQGSDIEGNYPILFGLNHDIQTLPISRILAETREARTKEPILVQSITHIEVPTEKIAETQDIVGQYGCTTPVVSIEAMEQHMAQKPFREVLLGTS